MTTNNETVVSYADSHYIIVADADCTVRLFLHPTHGWNICWSPLGGVGIDAQTGLIHACESNFSRRHR